jgi:hypothetical protein
MAGKEGWQKNVAVPLKGICIFGCDEENRIEQVSPMQVLPYIMRQIHYTDEPEIAGRTLELLNVMMADVPVYWLECEKPVGTGKMAVCPWRVKLGAYNIRSDN